MAQDLGGEKRQTTFTEHFNVLKLDIDEDSWWKKPFVLRLPACESAATDPIGCSDNDCGSLTDSDDNSVGITTNDTTDDDEVARASFAGEHALRDQPESNRGVLPRTRQQDEDGR